MGSIEPDAKGENEVVVRVRDNGLGIPKERRDQLFQRFFRAHDLSVSSAEGTGLGLSIVAETMESLGGRAWTEFPETGSVFAFALPYRRESTVDAKGKESPAATDGSTLVADSETLAPA